MNPMQTSLQTSQPVPSEERASAETIQRQAATLAQQPLIAELLNSVLNYVLILNQQRQIVFASKNLQKLAPNMGVRDLLGKRPGEALGCIRSVSFAGGCGTTPFCSECGAAKSVLASLAGRRDCQECHMIRVSGPEEDAIDLLVACSPLTVSAELYSLAAIADVSHEKRRRALERIFFHDVINSAGGLEGQMMMMDDQAPDDIRGQIESLRVSLRHIIEEILAQRDLVAAENNDLSVDPRPLNSRKVLQDVLQLYSSHPVANNRGLSIAPVSVSLDIVTDSRLLKRVLGNMIKNALEASQPDQSVTAGCEEEGSGVRFWVHNAAFMPRNVQLQVFNRSFSTKGSGRGLGTYSIRLLTKRYLKGTVGFSTNEKDGTTFFVILPRSISGTPA